MNYSFCINDKTNKRVILPKIKRQIPYHNGIYIYDIELSNLGLRERLYRKRLGEIPSCKPRAIRINNNYIYHYVNGEMDLVYEKLSDHMRNKKELLTSNRYGKCHSMSMKLVEMIPDSYILTGYVSYEDEDYLHSVIEFEKDGNTKIIDYTKNLIMDKEEYIGLTNFRLIQRISRKDYKKDKKIIKKYMPDLSNKVYLCFRDELMHDMNKKLILKRD